MCIWPETIALENAPPPRLVIVRPADLRSQGSTDAWKLTKVGVVLPAGLRNHTRSWIFVVICMNICMRVFDLAQCTVTKDTVDGGSTGLKLTSADRFKGGEPEVQWAIACLGPPSATHWQP